MNVLIDGPHWWNVAIGSWMVAAIVQAGLVAGAVLVAVRCFPRIPAHWRYALLLIALCKFAVPPYAALPTGLFSRLVVPHTTSASIPGESNTSHHQKVAAKSERLATPSPPPTRPRGATTSAVPSSGAASSPGGATTPGAARGESLLGDGVSGREVADAPPVPVLQQASAVVSLVAAVYVSGAGLGLLYLVLGLFRVRRWRRQSCSLGFASQWFDSDRSADLRLAKTAKKVPVLINRSIRVPMSTGLFRPSILFPASLESLLSSRRPADVRKVQTIVAHELTHHARGDLWVNFVQKILLCLWWFHPVMWWLDRALRETREDCCDDAVLNAGISDGYAYSRVLVEIAALTRHSSDISSLAIAMARSRNSLAHRIHRAMDDSVSRHGRLSRLGWVLSICVAFLLLPGFVRSADSSPPPATSVQSNPQQKEGQTDSPLQGNEAAKSKDRRSAAANSRQLVQDGRRQEDEAPSAAGTPDQSLRIVVLDEQGNPIPGAHVWRIADAGEQFMELDATNADGQTKATEKAIPRSPFGSPVEVLAWDGRERFGLVRVKTTPLQKHAEITCRSHYRTPLTVHDPDGEPVQGARVAVRLGQVDGERSTWIPDGLREKLQTITDEHGIANAFLVSSDSYLVIEVVSGQHGTQNIHLGEDDSKSAPLELQPTGRIEGQVELPEGAALSDVGDDYIIVTDSGGGIRTTPAVTGDAPIAPDAAGRFTIAQIVAGPLRVHRRSRYGKSRWQIQPVSDLHVEPGETASVTLNVDEARHVVGTVVDADTSKGVPGVVIIVDTRSQEIRRVTDEAGEFSFFMLPGHEGSIRYFPPDSYYLTRSDYIGGGKKLEIPEQLPDDMGAGSSAPRKLQPYQLEPMSVKRGVKVHGKVVDGSGEGMGDATIWINWSGQGDRFSHEVQSQTDADGSFAIDGVPPNQPLKLSAAQRGVRLVEKEIPAVPRRPLRLTVEAPKLAAFRIRVVDSNGSPVSGVRVEIHRSSYFGPHMSGYGSVYDSQTDAAGFVTTDQTHPVARPYTIKVFSGSELLTEKETRASDKAETITAELVIDRD